MKPKLYSYVRFSSTKQAAGNSLERQKDIATKIAARYNLELDTTAYHDLGMSAFKGKNAYQGKLSEFIKQIGKKVPKGSWLVIENLDRISRDDALSALDIFKSILSKDITIVTGMDERVYTYQDLKTNMIDLILSVMQFTRAHDESVTKKNRVEAQARSLIRYNLNRESGTPAKAIETVGANVWWVDTSTGFVLPHPELFEAARKIISLKLEGYSPFMIKDFMDHNFKSPKKRKTFKGDPDQWGISTINTILKPALYGEKKITLDKRDSNGMLVNNEKETFIIPDYYPPLISETAYFNLIKIDGQHSVERNDRLRSKGEKPDIPLLSGISILYCGKCGSYMYKGTVSPGKNYPYHCGSRITKQVKCDKHGFVGYPLETAVLQLIADHIWNSEQEDKTAWYEAEIAKAVISVQKLVKLAKLTDEIEELATEINDAKRKQLELERNLLEYKSNKVVVATGGWEEFRKFDVYDAKNVDRHRIRMKIKQAVKRIDAYNIDYRHHYFLITFVDGKTQKVVIKTARNRSPGKIYVDVHTINDAQIIESEGLVLHDHIDILINREKFMTEAKKRLDHPRTLIDELTE